MNSKPVKACLLFMIAIGLVLAVYAHLCPEIIQSRDFEQHTETLLETKKKVNYKDVEFIPLEIPRNGTLRIVWTSDERINFYLCDTANFERFAENKFHSVPRESVSNCTLAKDYSFSFETELDRYYLIFDNCEGGHNAHIKLTVTLHWSEVITSEQKQYPMIGWVGLILIAVGASNLILIKLLKKGE